MHIEIYNIDTERLYCPATGEEIFNFNRELEPDDHGFNYDASVVFGWWNSHIIEEPQIKDEELKNAWDDYYERVLKRREDFWFYLNEFFLRYNKPEWKVMRCNFNWQDHIHATFYENHYFVVRKDVVLEEWPGEE